MQIPTIVVAGIAGVVILLILLRHPEVAFALFLFSYVIEGGELIQSPFDSTAILLFITLAGFLLPVAAGKRVHFSPRAGDLWLFLFVITLFAGSYLTPNINGGVMKAVLFVTAVVLPYFTTRFFLKADRQIQNFLLTIVATAVAIATALTIKSLLPTYTGGRLHFYNANPIPTGTLLTIGLVIAVIRRTSSSLSKFSGEGILYTIAVPLCLYGLFLSGVRGPLISSVVGLAFYTVILLMRRARAAMIIVIIAIVSLGVIKQILPNIPNIAVYSTRAIMQGLSTQERLERYQAALNIFLRTPLLGAGTGSYTQLTGFNYPHNIFLEIAAENGLIGLLFFGLFLGSILRSGLRCAMHSADLDPQTLTINITVLVVSLTLLVEKQFSYNLTMHKDLFVFLGLVVNLSLVDYKIQRLPINKAKEGTLWRL